MVNRIMSPSGSPFTLLKSAVSYRVHPSRTGRLLISLIRASFQYPLIWIERVYAKKRIQNTKIEVPPVFIIGHFRSGTSLMHKLLAADPRWRHINEYELFFPYHSQLVQRWLKPLIQRVIRFLKMKHPNFNDYIIDLDDPNEDEALLISLGATWASYWSYIFPSHSREIISKTIAFQDDETKEAWKSSYLFFLKRLVWKKDGQLLIKSPSGTGRVKALLDLFPDAKFIYMYRDPLSVTRSMEKIWKQEILKYFCLQKPDWSTVQHQINANKELLIGAYQRDKHLVPEGNLIEICYEHFVTNQFATIESIYKQFQFCFDTPIQKLVKEKVDHGKSYRDSKYVDNKR